jgi:hypothetical protein
MHKPSSHLNTSDTSDYFHYSRIQSGDSIKVSFGIEKCEKKESPQNSTISRFSREILGLFQRRHIHQLRSRMRSRFYTFYTFS